MTTAFDPGQKLDAPTPFHDLSKLKPDVSRTLLINGGFLNNHASNADPKAFVYAFDGNAFPNVPLIQARLGSVEEWNFVNHNNDAHPIHVHVNDFQVTKYFDPTTGTKLGPQMFGEDNANVPAPSLGPNEAVIQAGTLTMRTKFNDYLGLVRAALPSAQPRRQWVDDAHQRHSRHLRLCGGGSGLAGPPGNGEGVRRPRRSFDNDRHAVCPISTERPASRSATSMPTGSTI